MLNWFKWFVVVGIVLIITWFILGLFTKVHAGFNHGRWEWTNWSGWSICQPKASCGITQGTQFRVRSCTWDDDSNGSDQCHQGQLDSETRNCTVPFVACPTPTPSPTPSPTPTPTPVPSPTPIPCDGYQTENGCYPYPTPTPNPTPDPTPLPEQPLTPAQAGPAPSCSDPEVTTLPQNAHVIRHSTWVEVKWVPQGGSLVNVYYTEGFLNKLPIDWKHALADEVNDGYVVIHGLVSSRDYTFGLSQRNKCSGETVMVIPDAFTHKIYLPYFYYYR